MRHVATLILLARICGTCMAAAPSFDAGLAQRLGADDSGEMVAEYHKLYSSTALMLINETHVKIVKTPM